MPKAEAVQARASQPPVGPTADSERIPPLEVEAIVGRRGNRDAVSELVINAGGSLGAEQCGEEESQGNCQPAESVMHSGNLARGARRAQCGV